MVEAVRSCLEMYRFCLASYVTLPFRAADIHNKLIRVTNRGLAATNHIGILGASITQDQISRVFCEHLDGRNVMECVFHYVLIVLIL